MKKFIENKMKSDLTNLISASGYNTTHIELLLARRSPSKTAIRIALKRQEEFNKQLEILKEEILKAIDLY